ncbi:unnamed protein product [Knipowitschia caucasica]|uniref:Uncharacterized protein n=2 Tax=Knipowitschia caucasica TaxID=637954 RepID=A0AAV2K762_KNICA
MSLTPLHHALRRAFQSVERNQRMWRSLLEDCEPLVVSLGNVGEQFVALSKVDLSRTPLIGLPGLEPKLRFKLHHAADTVMGKLQEKLLALQSVRDEVSSQVASVFQILDQVLVSEQVSALTERSAGAPSVADMLAWLQDAARHYRQQFIKRKALLLTLRPEGFSQMESAPENWRSLTSVNTEDTIHDMLWRVSFFLEPQ